ncbi:MAG: helix-turn-helix domain-containing protein [Cypionkella sp.]
MTPPVDPAAIVLRLKSAVEMNGGPTAVAKAAGINTSTLDSYVRGTSLPGALAITCLCRALDVSADWLLFGEVRA